MRGLDPRRHVRLDKRLPAKDTAAQVEVGLTHLSLHYEGGGRVVGVLLRRKHKYDDKLISRAKRLRNEPTSAEQTLWQYLRRSQLQGYKFRHQQPIGPFIVDFYCSSLKLAIELDGSSHKGKDGYDGFRESGIEGRGVRVIRFLNSEIMEDIDGVLAQIRRHFPPPQPSPSSGEGANSRR